MKPVPLGAIRPEVCELAPDIGSRPDVPIYLDWNESRWPLPEGVLSAMAEAVEGTDARPYPDRGYPAVREAIARLADWTPDGVAFGNGGDDMLALIGLATTGAGRRALHPSPGFSMYPWSVRLAGGTPVPVSLRDDLSYDVRELLRQIEAEQPSLVFITNPHNPTGQLLPLGALRELAAAAPGFLLVDEAYHEFSGQTARPLLDEFGNVILLRTFSKAMAMAGARLGYLLGAPDAIFNIRRAQPPFPVGVYTCRAAAAVMRQRDALLEMTVKITAERESLAVRLATVPGVRVWPSHTNFLLFRTPMESTVLARRLLDRGVALRDFSRHPLLRGTLRVTVGTPEENGIFLEALADSLSTAAQPSELEVAGVPESPVA
jgi:histidinol-phosphate aminotransferase